MAKIKIHCCDCGFDGEAEVIKDGVMSNGQHFSSYKCPQCGEPLFTIHDWGNLKGKYTEIKISGKGISVTKGKMSKTNKKKK
jgi:uncharacterized Zn finger protein